MRSTRSLRRSRRRQLEHGVLLSLGDNRLHGSARSKGVPPQETLDEWRRLGEVGQLIVGLAAGFSAAEIAHKRGWSAEDFDRYATETAGWLKSQRRDAR